MMSQGATLRWVLPLEKNEEKLYEYLHTRHGQLLDRIEAGSWEDSDIEEMKKALTDFRG